MHIENKSANAIGNPELTRGVTVTDGTRVGGTRQPRTRVRALSDMIVYRRNDDGTETLIEIVPKRKPRNAAKKRSQVKVVRASLAATDRRLVSGRNLQDYSAD